MNAIILAAGLGSRIPELTATMPKSLIKINDIPIIEYQIKYLNDIGVKDIYIVTGYMAEKFEYLREKYSVKLIYNDKYNIWNNFYSLYCVRDVFGDSYLLDADNYLTKNIFINNISDSTYFGIYRKDCKNEYFIHVDENNKINEISVENRDGLIVAGISFWNKNTANKIISLMEYVYSKGEHTNIYWDDIVRLNLDKIDVFVHELNQSDVFEIDTYEDYEAANLAAKIYTKN